MTKTFAEATRKFLEEELDINALFAPGGVHYLSDIVESCFLQKETKLSKEKKAVIILSSLFSSLVPTFCFDRFLKKIASPKERTAFLSFLLQHLFYGNFPLKALLSKDTCRSYLIQQLATVAKEETVTHLWGGLSFTAKVKTLGFCYKNYEEGSLFLSQIARKNRIFEDFCDYIDRGLINRSTLFEWEAVHSTISKSQFALFFAQQKKKIQQKIAQIKMVLQKQYNVKMSIATLSKFISIFGLYGFQVPEKSSDELRSASLDQQLQMDEEGSSLIAGALLDCLHSFSENPKNYIEQTKKLVLAVPTTSRVLERLPWLSSMLSCLKTLTLYQNCPEISIKDYPLFVFDQSEPKIFQKNSRYITKLNKDYKASIIHLGKKQLIILSEKLRLKKMVVTSPDDHFGYGGARNAIFLIAPVLHAIFQKHGLSCIGKALSTPDEELQMLFKQVVFSENALVIHMGEDDLWEPPATLISDAFFAFRNQDDYFFRMGSSIGRETAYARGCFDAENLLSGSRSIYSQFAWSEKQVLTGMRGILSKPKICLNLPFGNEEPHLQAQKNTFFDFRRNAIHFSGWRYPKEKIPTSHFVGITDFLHTHNPYVFGLQLVEELLRPVEYKRTPLVWNRRKEPFSTLQEAIDCIANEKTSKTMQKQFWKNLEEHLLGFTTQSSKTTTATILRDLLEKEFSDSLICQNKKELQKLKDYLQELVQQAREYKEFAESIMTEMKKGKNPKMATDQAKEAIEKRYQRPLESMPFAYTLYLLCLMIGAGGFQETLKLTPITFSRISTST